MVAFFSADFFTVYAEFFTVHKGRKRWKNISLLIWAFSRLVFHGLPPLEPGECWRLRYLLYRNRGKFERFQQLRLFQKKAWCPKNFRPQFWGWKWLRQFYGRLAFFGSFCWITPMPIKFLFLGGGCVGVSWKGGGRSANFIFMGAGMFSDCCFETRVKRGTC